MIFTFVYGLQPFSIERHSQPCLKNFTPVEVSQFFPALKNIVHIVACEALSIRIEG